MLSQSSRAQTERVLIEYLNEQFADLHLHWIERLETCDDDSLYLEEPVAPNESSPASVGEMIRRSAAVVEQMCGGLLANLWDDPYEWTLPETLRTRAKIRNYLDEVKSTRERTFATFVSDNDLSRSIVLPSGEMCTLRDLLSQTLAKATEYCSG